MASSEKSPEAVAPNAAGFDYTAISPGYYDGVFHRRAGLQAKWHHLKFAYLRRALPPGGELLDIGCGPGTFIGTLGADRTAIGVDIAPGQIDYARKHYQTERHTFEIMEPGRLPFDDGRFGAVSLVELVEHLPARESAALLWEVHRVLAPEGVLILSTPNYASLWPVLEWALNRMGPVSYAEQHITRFDRRRLRALVTDAGFSGVRITAFQWAAPFAAVLNWRLADAIDSMEPTVLVARFGFLLAATGRKAR